MAQAHDEVTWERARTAVVVHGKSYTQAAEDTGISPSALQKRAGQERWQDQRSQELQRKSAYLGNVRDLKAELLQEVRKSKDPQQLHALLALERAFPEHRYAQVSDGEKRGIVAVVVEQLVQYLGDADANLLGAFRSHLRPFAEHLVKTDWRAPE